METKTVKKKVNRLLGFAYIGVVITLFEIVGATYMFAINDSFAKIPLYELIFFYGYLFGLLGLLVWFVSHRDYLERKAGEYQLQKDIRGDTNKSTLKIWIALFFGVFFIQIYSFVMFAGGRPEYFVPLSLCFVACLAMYHFVLKDEFEKMQEEYEEAGSLKKTIKKWKEGDTE